MSKKRAVATVAAAICTCLAITSCASQPQSTPLPPPETAASARPLASTSASSSTGVSCTYTADRTPASKAVDPPPTTDVSASGTATYTLKMKQGDVKITLDRAKAPCTVNSFDALVRQGYYDQTSCHRLVDRGIFILQCGDPTGTGRGGPGYRFDDELSGHETYPAGTIAMANAGPNTNGSQFFIVWADTPLPAQYTVFGSVDEKSLSVIQKIASHGVSKDRAPAPIDDTTITSVVAG